MSEILPAVSYSLTWLLAEIPVSIVFYFIFEPVGTPRKNKIIAIYYTFLLLIETVIAFACFDSGFLPYSWLSMKKLCYVYWLPFLLPACTLLRPYLFQTIFTLGLLGMSVFAVHTLLINVILLFLPSSLLIANILFYFLVYTFVYTCLMPLLLFFFRKIFLEYHLIEQLEFWKYFAWIPLLLMLYSILLSYRDLPLGRLYLLPRSMQLLSALVIALTLYLGLLQVKKRLALQHENNALLAHIEMFTDYAHMLQNSQERMRIFRHDTRHQLLILNSLLAQKDGPAALSFLHNLEQDLTSLHIWQGRISPHLQKELHPLKQKIQQASVSLALDIDLPYLSPDFEQELADILSLMLQAALIALKPIPPTQRSLTFIAHQTNTAVILFICNRHNQDLVLDKNGFPITEPYVKAVPALTSFCQRHQAVYKYNSNREWIDIHLRIPYKGVKA